MKKTRLIDTNILIYAVDESSFYHKKAHLFLESILSQENICIAIQNITEFYAIVTNPKRVRVPLTQDKAREAITQLIKSNLFTIILHKQNTPQTIITLLSKFKIKSSEIHDIHLAATMIDNNIQTIYTADTSVFIRLGLNVINPLQ